MEDWNNIDWMNLLVMIDCLTVADEEQGVE